MAANPFTRHPHAAGETYRQHFAVAMGVSRQLAGASIAAFVHALFPPAHQHTASDRIHGLHDCLERGDRDGLRRDARHHTPDDP
jgi:Family of unknown function (DUF6356)